MEERLRRLEAAEAIRQCVCDYALAGDRANDPGIMRRIFTHDALYEAAGMGQFQGLDAVVDGLAEIAREAVLWAFHSPGGPRIRLAPDVRSAKVFWWVWVAARLKDGAAEVPVLAGGHYNADMVDEGGSWKFRRLLFEPKLRTPFDGPWTEIAGDFEWPE